MKTIYLTTNKVREGECIKKSDDTRVMSYRCLKDMTAQSITLAGVRASVTLASLNMRTATQM